VINPQDNPEKTLLAFKCHGAKKMMENGGLDFLKERYAEFYKGESFGDYDIVLSTDPKSKPQKVKAPSGASDEEKTKIKEENAEVKVKLAEMADEIAGKWAGFKSDFMGAPIRKVLIDLQEENKETYLTEIPYRKDEKYWIKKTDTNAVFYFNVHFTNPTDIALAKIMLNELKDSKKISSQAVSVNYFPKIDTSMENINELGVDPKKSSCGVISFTLNKAHTKKNMETAVYFLTTFRQYVEFHIRMVKCLLHSRMRKRIAKLEIVFERALRSGVTNQVEYKTNIGGAAQSDKPEEEKINTFTKKRAIDTEEHAIGDD
jgi:hypothetical protein